MTTLCIGVVFGLSACGDGSGNGGGSGGDAGSGGGIGGEGGGGGAGGAGGGDLHRCDLRDANDYCQEYAGLEADGAVSAYESACPGDWSAEACPRANALGGCRSEPGGGFTFAMTNWFYSDTGGPYASASEVQQGCDAGGNTYVAP